MSENARSCSTDIVPRRLDITLREPLDRWETIGQTTHRRAAPAAPGCANWTNNVSQRYVRAMALDKHRGLVWTATWGGVFCWNVNDEICTHYTSEHGLHGNAMRTVAVDSNGIVWAGGHGSGLFFLLPEADAVWQSHPDLEGWTVRCLGGHPQGGVYAALQHADGRYGLGEVISPTNRLCLLLENGTGCRAIDALLVDEDGTLWTGNAWGLHCIHDTKRTRSPLLDAQETRLQVRTLAVAAEGGLWVGSNYGVYRCWPGPDTPLTRENDWPREDIISLASGLETLWVATVHEVGAIAGNEWQPVQETPPGQVSMLLAPELPGHKAYRQPAVWTGGSHGIFAVDKQTCRRAVSDTPEDGLSNAVQCLYAGEQYVWMGTPRGLFRFDGQGWRGDDDVNSFALRDVRAIVPGPTPEQLWAGSWRGGPGYMAEAVYIASQELPGPLVSLAVGADDSLWAATLDKIFWYLPDSDTWQPVKSPLPSILLRAHVVQTICHQIATGTGGEPEPTLWVGTSGGLRRYRPELDIWDSLQDFAANDNDLEHLPIQTLALNPQTNRLWIGTPAGLFNEDTWQCQHECDECDVRALAFSRTPRITLWVGTFAGLQQWLVADGQDCISKNPAGYYTAANAGLAANEVTALAVRETGDTRELLVGTPAGISRLTW